MTENKDSQKEKAKRLYELIMRQCIVEFLEENRKELIKRADKRLKELKDFQEKTK